MTMGRVMGDIGSVFIAMIVDRAYKHARGGVGWVQIGGTDEPIGENDLTRRGVPDERGRNAPARRCP